MPSRFSHVWLCDCSIPGSSVHGDSPGKNTGESCLPSSRGSSPPRDWTLISHLLHWQVGSLPQAMLKIWWTWVRPVGKGGPESDRQSCQTHKAVGVLRSRTASSTLPVTAVTHVGSIASAITLFCTHSPCHCRRQRQRLIKASRQEKLRVIWSSWEKLRPGVSNNLLNHHWLSSANIYCVKSATDQNYYTKSFKINTWICF